MEQQRQRWFGLSRQVWECHSNPWSVWTRAATAPPLFAAVWLHTWSGWASLVLLVILIVWLLLNPVLFPRPRSTDNWSSKATFGERVWADRKRLELPGHFRLLPWLLAGLAGVGFAGGLVACWYNLFWPAFCGLCLTYMGKLWFLDRMVWLYELQAARDLELRTWVY